VLSGEQRLAAHAAGRKAADANMLRPGSKAWNDAYKIAVTNGIDVFGGGAGILDTSKSQSYEVNYNLQDLVSEVDIIVGGSYRDYTLESNGTLFTDYDAPIEFTDMGMYAQAQKSLFGGGLKLTGSMRYDKSEFFDGNITPRIGALVSLSKNQNIRISYQTGYQNPSSQDQYIGLDAGAAVLMGSSPDNVDRFKMKFRSESVTSNPFYKPTHVIDGNRVKNNSLTIASVQAFGAAAAAGNVDPSLLVSAGDI
jgi:outer membrane receptor protein involved in Fe transport